MTKPAWFQAPLASIGLALCRSLTTTTTTTITTTAATRRRREDPYPAIIRASKPSKVKKLNERFLLKNNIYLNYHGECKEMPVFPVNRVVDKKIITGKNGGPRRRRGIRGH
jgi:hypothetical protein